MTAKEYSKRYDLALNFKKVAELAFNEGLKKGREETKTDKIRLMEKELKELRTYKKEMEECMAEGDKLAELIGGL